MTPTDTYSGAEGACTAVSPTQVAAVLGAQATPDGAGDKCYLTAGERKVTVYVTSLSGGGYADLQDFVDSSSANTMTEQKVDGIGDAAFFSKADSEMSVVVGDQLLQIQLVLDSASADLDPTSDKSAELAGTTQLAATAAARAPISIG